MIHSTNALLDLKKLLIAEGRKGLYLGARLYTDGAYKYRNSFRDKAADKCYDLFLKINRIYDLRYHRRFSCNGIRKNLCF